MNKIPKITGVMYVYAGNNATQILTRKNGVKFLSDAMVILKRTITLQLQQQLLQSMPKYHLHLPNFLYA